MKTAQAVYEDYEKTGVLALPQDEAKISGRGSTSPGLMDITFVDGSTLIFSVTRYLTGFAAGRESVHISWADGDE